MLLHDGEVLTAIDSAQRAGGRARTPIVDGAPLGAEFVHDSGMPELRHRVALHHEDVRKHPDTTRPNRKVRNELFGIFVEVVKRLTPIVVIYRV